MLLHLGCGNVDAPQFISIDLQPHRHVHYLRNVTSPTMWHAQSADLIYACHVLEHVERAEVPRVLANWHRFLKPEGILRLSVPDFDAIWRIYEASGRDIDAIAGYLMGGQRDRFDVHMSVFNQAYLCGLIEDAGFRGVRKWDPATTAHHDFDDWASRTVQVMGRHFDSV